MISCIKTGAQLWIESYRCWAHCDAFASDDLFIFRITAVSFSEALGPRKHFTVHRVDQWWDQGAHNQGQVETLVSSVATFHDYEGIPYSQFEGEP